MTIGIEACNAPDDVISYLYSIAAEAIADNLRDPSAMKIEDFDPTNITVMEPYQVNCIYRGSHSMSEAYLFPVVSGKKVLFNIAVYYLDDDLYYSVSNELHQELTELINSPNVAQIYYHYSDDFEQLSTSIIESADVDTANSIRVLADFSYAVSELSNAPSLTLTYPTNGFSANTDTFKMLDISYCLVLQNNTLCAMPCIATIYRYRTRTFEMTAESLTALNDQSGYGYNVKTTAGQVGLINKIMPVVPECEYKEYRGVLTNYVVMHNINNAFPFIFGGLCDSGAHAFVLYGYQLNGSSMKWWYFNPWGDDTSTTYHNDGDIVSFYSGGKV